MRSLGLAIEGMTAFLTDTDKRRKVLREVHEELGIPEGATYTQEQKKAVIEALANRLVKGAEGL